MKDNWYVVTPVSNEPLEWLVKCHESVVMQSVSLGSLGFPGNVVHVLVYDGITSARLSRIAKEAVEIAIATSALDFGDTPRSVGSAYAISKKAFAISYLDGDNWWSADHLSKVYSAFLHSRSSVITTKRELMHLNGTPLGVVCLTSDGEKFADTSCLTFFEGGIHLGVEWMNIPDNEHIIDDRVIWYLIKDLKLKRDHVDAATVKYRVKSQGVYRDLGEDIPVDSRPNDVRIEEAVNCFKARTGHDCTLKWTYSVSLNCHVRVSKLLQKYIDEKNYLEYQKLIDATKLKIHD